jgi:hypothetical protein
MALALRCACGHKDTKGLRSKDVRHEDEQGTKNYLKRVYVLVIRVYFRICISDLTPSPRSPQSPQRLIKKRLAQPVSKTELGGLCGLGGLGVKSLISLKSYVNDYVFRFLVP